MAETVELWCDGGLIGRNPSKLGGTWSWCWVQDGKMIQNNSGVILPEHIGVNSVTNNLAELLAATHALNSVPESQEGILHTDSRVTLLRITKGMNRNTPGVPEHLRQELLRLRLTRRWRTVLVAGHPTKEELARGYRLRNGLPVSRWNQFCDAECQRVAREFLARRTP